MHLVLLNQSVNQNTFNWIQGQNIVNSPRYKLMTRVSMWVPQRSQNDVIHITFVMTRVEPASKKYSLVQNLNIIYKIYMHLVLLNQSVNQTTFNWIQSQNIVNSPRYKLMTRVSMWVPQRSQNDVIHITFVGNFIKETEKSQYFF